MISLFSYLYEKDGKPRAAASDGPSEALGRLSIGLIDAIGRCVLTGETSAPLRAQLEQTKELLIQAQSPAEILDTEAKLVRILADYRGGAQQASMAQAVEVQHIFGMLNHTLIVMSEGRDRSVSRLSDIQNTLKRTSQLRDIVAMKSALADTVKFVEKEAADARKVVNEELARLETEVGEARAAIGTATADPAGRPEGVARIEASLAGLAEGQALYTLAYVCGRLSGITQRYGPQVTEELVFRVIRERLRAVAQDAAVYRWTPAALVGTFIRPRNLAALDAEVAMLNRAPVVHRVALGNRTAVLTMSPSRLLLEGAGGDPSVLVDRLDRFVAGIA